MKALTNWRKATKELTKEFLKKYFPEEVYGKDTYWVCDEIGSVFFVSDYFFTLDRIVDSLQLKVPVKELFEYYDFELEHAMNNPNTPTPINFKNYVAGFRETNFDKAILEECRMDG